MTLTLVLEVVLRVAGLFYVFGGIALSRAIATDVMLDRALHKITLEPTPKREKHRAAYWFVVSFFMFAGGVLLVFLIDWAVVGFLVSAVLQGLYLAYIGPRYLDDTEEEDHAETRAKSIRATWIYAGVTVVVIAGAVMGVLVSGQAMPWWMLVLIAGLILAQTAYLANLIRPRKGGI
jgi:MFS family permease